MADEIENYYKHMEFEHELINRRITWLLTSETILFAAFGIFLKDEFLGKSAQSYYMYIKWVGSLIAVFILIGVFAGIRAKYFLWKDIRQKHPEQQFGVRLHTTILGFVPDIFLPLLFLMTWLLL